MPTPKLFDFGTDVSPLPVLQAGFVAKGLKTWDTMDGGGYQFNLYFQNAKVAQVTQGGRGGDTNLCWDFSAKGARAKKVEAAKAKLSEIAAATDPVPFNDSTLDVDEEWLMEALMEGSPLATKCKKFVVFQGAQDEAGSYRTLKCAYDDGAKAFLAKKYPDAAILNDILAS